LYFNYLHLFSPGIAKKQAPFFVLKTEKHLPKMTDLMKLLLFNLPAKE